MLVRWLFGLIGLVLWGCAPDLDIEALPETPERPERIEGIWEGTIEVADLRVVVHVAHEEGAFKGGVLSATLDSPDQGAQGIAVDDVRFDGERFALRIDKLGAAYSGTMDATGTRLAGEWHQGVGIDLELVKVDEPSVRVRAQTPQPPFPYAIEEVVFPGGADDVRLAGTLTMPETGAYPTVVLVTGSGPQDRNETLMGHQPFRVLADYLSRNGVAVLRYDDRGFGGSTGDFAGATTLDFADDAAAAVAYLRTRADVAPDRVGVIGHSEGGLVVADLAAGGRNLSCGVMLAGPAVSGEAVHQAQIRLVVDASSVPIPDSTIDRIAALNATLYVAARGSGLGRSATRKVSGATEPRWKSSTSWSAACCNWTPTIPPWWTRSSPHGSCTSSTTTLATTWRPRRCRSWRCTASWTCRCRRSRASRAGGDRSPGRTFRYSGPAGPQPSLPDRGNRISGGIRTHRGDHVAGDAIDDRGLGRGPLLSGQDGNAGTSATGSAPMSSGSIRVPGWSRACRGRRWARALDVACGAGRNAAVPGRTRVRGDRDRCIARRAGAGGGVGGGAGCHGRLAPAGPRRRPGHCGTLRPRRPDPLRGPRTRRCTVHDARTRGLPDRRGTSGDAPR